MKVKVIKPFSDKYTKVIYQKGQEIEVSDERYDEINSTAHGVLVEEIKTQKKSKK